MDWTTIVVYNVYASKGPHMKRNVSWHNGVWRQFSGEKQERTIAHELCFGSATAHL